MAADTVLQFARAAKTRYIKAGTLPAGIVPNCVTKTRLVQPKTIYATSFRLLAIKGKNDRGSTLEGRLWNEVDTVNTLSSQMLIHNETRFVATAIAIFELVHLLVAQASRVARTTTSNWNHTASN